jgi:hypothetical protein
MHGGPTHTHPRHLLNAQKGHHIENSQTKMMLALLVKPGKKHFQTNTNNNWLVVSTLLKHMKVSWDYYSQYMGKSKMFQTTNQITYNNNSHPIAIHVSAIITVKLVVLL